MYKLSLYHRLENKFSHNHNGVSGYLLTFCAFGQNFRDLHIYREIRFSDCKRFAMFIEKPREHGQNVNLKFVKPGNFEASIAQMNSAINFISKRCKKRLKPEKAKFKMMRILNGK